VIVECPACRTRYRTESAGLIEGNTFFECTKEDCQHVFPYTPPLLQRGNNKTHFSDIPIQPQFSDNTQAVSPKDLADPVFTEEPIDNEPPSLSQEDDLSFPDPNDDLEDFPAPEVPFVTEGEDESTRIEVAHPRRPASRTEMSFSVRPFLIVLGLIIVGHAALAFYCLSHPDETEALLARLPVLGPLFAPERTSAQQIALLDLKGSFWLTKDGRRVFAISGKVVNDAPVPARNIQIEGLIYDAEGKAIGQRVIFCGTETAPAVLERLTVREIGILQNLVPPKQFNVPAGQSVNFLVVFTSLPSVPIQFSCRVLAAQFG
jgi:hypothetical protein